MSDTNPNGFRDRQHSPDLRVRDWIEDAAHENGGYYCRCVYCQKQFIGHKRRAICRLCNNDPEALSMIEAAITRQENENEK